MASRGRGTYSDIVRCGAPIQEIRRNKESKRGSPQEIQEEGSNGDPDIETYTKKKWTREPSKRKQKRKEHNKAHKNKKWRRECLEIREDSEDETSNEKVDEEEIHRKKKCTRISSKKQKDKGKGRANEDSDQSFGGQDVPYFEEEHIRAEIPPTETFHSNYEQGENAKASSSKDIQDVLVGNLRGQDIHLEEESIRIEPPSPKEANFGHEQQKKEKDTKKKVSLVIILV